MAIVDLSGPHEPSPRPGNQIARHMCAYLLVLTVRPDRPPGTGRSVDAETQTASADQQTQSAPAAPQTATDTAGNSEDVDLARSLVYVAPLGCKSEATEAIKSLLAQVNNDHASLPHTLVYRLHSDRRG